MDLSEQAYQRFIDLIYDAAEHPARWRALHEELRGALGVASVHMLAFDKQHGALSYSDGANMPVQGELAYMQHYRTIDPRLPVVMQRPVGPWTHCHEFLTAETVASHPFYQEFLLPYDRRYMSACKLAESDAATVILSLLSSTGQGPLGGAALDFVDRLLPHLRRACRIGMRNFVYSTQALVGHMLVDKLRQPVLLMDAGGNVMHTNLAAQALMRSTTLVQVERGRLKLPARAQEELMRRCAALEQALKQAASDPRAPPEADAGEFQSLHVPAAPGRAPLYAFFTMLSPQGAMGTFGLRPVVMLLFFHPASAPAVDATLLHAVFGLTPAECRVATLLAEGLPLKQIAQLQGTQTETVRKQLQSIYQKTATNRQPDLVRLLLHLPHTRVRH